MDHIHETFIENNCSGVIESDQEMITVIEDVFFSVFFSALTLLHQEMEVRTLLMRTRW